MTQENTLVQAENLMTHPAAREAAEKEDLRIIACWWEIGSAAFEVYDPEKCEFCPMPEPTEDWVQRIGKQTAQKALESAREREGSS